MKHVPLGPWSSQQGDQITTDASGAEINRIPFKWRTRGVLEQEIDRCIYMVIPLETYYYEPSGTSMVEFLWLTDVGIALNTGQSDTYGAWPRQPLSLTAAEE